MTEVETVKNLARLANRQGKQETVNKATRSWRSVPSFNSRWTTSDIALRALAAKNKCLAERNKTRTAGKATNKQTDLLHTGRPQCADRAVQFRVPPRLTDQTVIQNLEHVRSYRAFERTLIASVDPRSVIELALVHRLASLLWRLRRASAIETGLFEIQGELLIVRRKDSSRGPSQPGAPTTPTRVNGHSKGPGSNGRDHPTASDQEPLSTSMRSPLGPWPKARAIAQCFLRLSNLDPTLLDRVGSYETRL
jgi:hypothetical protein